MEQEGTTQNERKGNEYKRLCYHLASFTARYWIQNKRRIHVAELYEVAGLSPKTLRHMSATHSTRLVGSVGFGHWVRLFEHTDTLEPFVSALEQGLTNELAQKGLPDRFVPLPAEEGVEASQRLVHINTVRERVLLCGSRQSLAEELDISASTVNALFNYQSDAILRMRAGTLVQWLCHSGQAPWAEQFFERLEGQALHIGEHWLPEQASPSASQQILGRDIFLR